MKTRVELKEIAKANLKENYTTAIVTYVLYMLVVSVASSITLGIGAVLIVPLACGLNLTYLLLWKKENPSIDVMFTSAFQENYARKLGGMLWMELFTFLWSCLFVVPGVVKMCSYAATPYILAKYSGVPAQEALRISMRIMEGHKLDYFVLGLSFFGWQLLGLLTFGILNVFWVQPYMMMANAGFFEECLADAVDNGRVDAGELAVQ